MELNEQEIKLIDASLNFGKAGVFEFVELIIENYFFGVRQSDKDFKKQGENILKVLKKEIEAPLLDGPGNYDRYSAPTMEKYRAFAKEQIWLWFNLNTIRFEEFMEKQEYYQEWNNFEQPFHEFVHFIFDDFYSLYDYPTTFLGETTPNTKEALDELFEITDFTKKPNK